MSLYKSIIEGELTKGKDVFLIYLSIFLVVREPKVGKRKEYFCCCNDIQQKQETIIQSGRMRGVNSERKRERGEGGRDCPLIMLSRLAGMTSGRSRMGKRVL